VVIVSDTTVIIALAKIERLRLLKELWQTILIPESVKEEVIEEKPGAKIFREAIKEGWIIVKEIQENDVVKILRSHLGAGESECIALALEQKAHLLITDDKKAKSYAKKIGLNVIGTLGLIVQAVGESVITAEEAVGMIQKLKEIDFRLSNAVIDQAKGLIFKH